MPAINYLAEVDRLKAKRDLHPIIEDMTKGELIATLLYILHGIDIYKAIDSAMMTRKWRWK